MICAVRPPHFMLIYPEPRFHMGLIRRLNVKLAHIRGLCVVAEIGLVPTDLEKRSVRFSENRP